MSRCRCKSRSATTCHALFCRQEEVGRPGNPDALDAGLRREAASSGQRQPIQSAISGAAIRDGFGSGALWPAAKSLQRGPRQLIEPRGSLRDICSQSGPHPGSPEPLDVVRDTGNRLFAALRPEIVADVIGHGHQALAAIAVGRCRHGGDGFI